MTASPTCPLCDVVAEKRPVPGGLLLREGGFVLHAVAAPSHVRGWLVLTSERHTRAIYSLDDQETAALAVLARRVMRAQLEALGAEHVYQFAIGEQVHHCHVHLVPRFADTPARLRGPKCFDLTPDDALDDDALAQAASAVAALLRSGR